MSEVYSDSYTPPVVSLKDQIPTHIQLADMRTNNNGEEAFITGVFLFGQGKYMLI